MPTSKKPGRPPLALTPTATEPAFDNEAIQAKGAAPAQLVVAQDAMEAAVLLGQLVGGMQTATFFAHVADCVVLDLFENLKKSRTWANLRNPKSCDGRNFASLEEFCEVKLGKSYRRLQEVVTNRGLLGQAAFEQAEQLGLRQRDYNAMKALPAPERELVRRAVEDASTRDEVVDLIQELASRAGKRDSEQQAALRKKDAVIERLEHVNRELNNELALEKKLKVAATDWPERFKGLMDQADQAERAIRLALGALDAVRQTATEDKAQSPEEEASLQRARETLADRMAAMLRTSAHAVEALSMLFDQTLGAYATQGGALE